ncbi:hypothetical protein SAMN05216436_12749 [bacterium A37T11]|nr:hypothetical protein SAMN05216436_12749 [bacterium A37T11]
MLKISLGTLVLGYSLLVSACGGGAKEENAKLEKEVLQAHDSIMAYMGDFNHKSMKIDSILQNLDSLKAADASLDTAAKRADLASIKLKLDDANEAMTDWMHKFEPDQSGHPDDEVKKYLQGEKAKLDVLKRQFDAAKLASDKL